MIVMHLPDQTCKQAEIYYYEMLSDSDQSNIPDEVLEHIHRCPYCQERMQRLQRHLERDCRPDAMKSKSGRELVRMLHLDRTDQEITCQAVKGYLPQLAKTADRIAVPTPITLHIDQCAECRQDLLCLQDWDLDHERIGLISAWLSGVSDMDSNPLDAERLDLNPEAYAFLSETLRQIKDRPDSGVVTRYSLASRQDALIPADPQDVYEAFPINVQTTIKPKTMGSKRKSMPLADIEIKPMIWLRNPIVVKSIVAAVVLIMVALLFKGTSNAVTAVNYEKIFNSLHQASNVHIRRYCSEEKKLVDERWISTDLGLYVYWRVSENRLVFNDLRTGIQKEKDLNLGQIEDRRLSNDSLEALKRNMIKSLGILPLELKAYAFPEDAIWADMNQFDAEDSTGHPMMRIYEVIYGVHCLSDSESGRTRYKWRGYIEQDTHRPIRTELFRFDHDLETFKLVTIFTVEYLTDERMDALAMKWKQAFNREGSLKRIP